MRKLFLILSALAAFLFYQSSIDSSGIEVPEVAPRDSMFEKAVEIIKRYETLHQPRHWPLVGYGHKVMPGEKFSHSKTMPEADAEALLRKDLLKNCAVFRDFGRDSLILGVLAYNIGPGATRRSSVVKKLAAGNRDIRDTYLSYCHYRGKLLSQLKRRRAEEFDTLFLEEELLNDIDSVVGQADTLIGGIAPRTNVINK